MKDDLIFTVEEAVFWIFGMQYPNEEYYHVPLKYLFWGGEVEVNIPDIHLQPHYLFWRLELSVDQYRQTGEFRAKGGDRGVLFAYSKEKTDKLYFVLFFTEKQFYSRFLSIETKTGRVGLFGDRLLLRANIVLSMNLGNVQLQNPRIQLTNLLSLPVILEETQLTGKYEVATSFSVRIRDLLSEGVEINNPIRFLIGVDGTEVSFNLASDRPLSERKKYSYLPLSRYATKHRVVFIRKNIYNHYNLVIRQKEAEEKNVFFRFMDSTAISIILYYLGLVWQKISRKNINLYYEKYAGKADEGTWELFKKALTSANTRNYFVLDQRSKQWGDMSSNRHVIAKYSLKYYFLLYCASTCISTEIPSHLSVFRSANYYIRRAEMDKQFVFLQHGVTYMKRQGRTSAFGKDKEGEPSFIVVGSKKEEHVVCEMLKKTPEECILAGLPVFDTLAYGHITVASKDIITVSITWKPYEEYMTAGFEHSTYYRDTVDLFRILSLYMSAGNIRIVPHPKFVNLMLSTDLGPYIWNGTMSEALAETKLLITDYSSVCYNAFYQGAGVVFYQPTLQEYERKVGKLIPEEDEYIGYRVFDIPAVQKVISGGISGGKIDLSYFRKPEFVRNYQQINEFHDGKNTERIYQFLTDKGIV